MKVGMNGLAGLGVVGLGAEGEAQLILKQINASLFPTALNK